MPITFSPAGGDILMCDFGPDPLGRDTYPLAKGPCSVSPEMVKRRHVMVLSGRGMIFTVVPFSTVAPSPSRNFHLHIPPDTYPFFAAGEDNWLKGDMITAVSRSRLDRVLYAGKYQKASLSEADFAKGRECVLHAIGLGILTPYLSPELTLVTTLSKSSASAVLIPQ